MRFTLKGTNLLVTPILREYIERKMARLAKVAERLNKDAICRLEIARTTRHHRKGRIWRTEINCEIPAIRKGILRAMSENWDARAALDEAVREMERQIKEFRDLLAAKYRVGAREFKRRIREEG